MSVSVRTVRILGVVILVAGIPSTVAMWHDQGVWLGVLTGGIHAYVGVFLIFVMPWLLSRARERRSSGPP